MKRKIILISLTGGLALLGGAALCNEDILRLYTIVSASLLALVAVGGVLQYTSQEYEDFRDIYREKDRLQKEKIRILTETLINKEKENILEKSQLASESTQQQLNKEECVTLSCDSQLSKLS